jgi:DNA-binding phage protein
MIHFSRCNFLLELLTENCISNYSHILCFITCTAIKMYNSNLHSVSEVEKTTGVSKENLYRYLKSRAKHLNKTDIG